MNLDAAKRDNLMEQKNKTQLYYVNMIVVVIIEVLNGIEKKIHLCVLQNIYVICC